MANILKTIIEIDHAIDIAQHIGKKIAGIIDDLPEATVTHRTIEKKPAKKPAKKAGKK